ncbi:MULTISPECIES: hypothetical protein [unclassified Chryseobacterium]|uniref:hypothetical protein n=1 Tax=unclassified Chryseobacterium TaxID=2593645 RepID=UPI001AE26AF2|nr:MULTISPECIES: hypothetical protein [unclassified Chryseobacterium]MBP1167401.1 hypothetical protein [Chryseobacterium sp. PvR013]MDR4893265.1 hypothetical protein [Chryseobacterium sp. CFS7]
MNEILLINLKELKFLKNKNEYVFLNFAYGDALMITSFYDKIRKKERNNLIRLFNQLTNIELRTDDILGKLHIDILKILVDQKKDTIIITNIGFPSESISFLIDNFNKVFSNLNTLKNKKVIIVECELNNPENDKYFEEYFNE